MFSSRLKTLLAEPMFDYGRREKHSREGAYSSQKTGQRISTQGMAGLPALSTTPQNLSIRRFGHKKVLVPIIVVTFTVLLTLSMGINIVNAQGSMLDQGKTLMEKGKMTQGGGTTEKAPTVRQDESLGKGTSTERQETLTDKGKALMEKQDLMNKGKGLINQGK